MKKIMKRKYSKMLLSVLVTALMQSAVVFPVDAAPSDYAHWDFETDEAGVQESGQGSDDGPTITYIDGGKELYLNRWATVENEDEIVPDPVKNDGQNYVLKIPKKGRELIRYEYTYGTDGAPRKSVMEFNVFAEKEYSGVRVMVGGSCLFGIWGTALNKYYDASQPVGEMVQNSWNNIRMIFDYQATLSEGVYTFDEKSNITVYLNNQEIMNIPYDGINLDTNLISITGSDSVDVYFDDIKAYTVPGETEYSINDYAGRMFINGKELLFKVDEIIGEDYECTPLDKVEYYDNGVKVGGSTVAPYNIYYAPKTAGSHEITAKGYIADIFGDDPVFEDSTTVLIDAPFQETTITAENFETYTDGVTNWKYDDEDGKWVIRNTTSESAPKTIEVDTAHGKSLDMGTDVGRSITHEIDLSSGTIKASGEYYFTDEAWSSLLFVLNNGITDVVGTIVHGSSLQDIVNATDYTGRELAKIETGKWYKIDYVTTFTEDKGYYSLYVNGERMAQNAYAFVEGEATRGYLNKMNKVTFAAINHESPVYVDNLSISSIEYFDNTGFIDNNQEINTLKEMEGTVLTAKTPYHNGDEAIQYMCIYNKASKQLIDIVRGTYDAKTNTFTASYDLAELMTEDIDVEAKVFLWAGMRPICENAAIN